MDSSLPRVGLCVVEDDELVVVRVAVELGPDGVLEPFEIKKCFVIVFSK
jgi:hypothetical protein